MRARPWARRVAELSASSALCVTLLTAASVRADSSARSQHTRVRAELSGGDTFDGHGRWLHDPYILHAVELEWLLWGHVSMGLRGLPALVYLDVQPVLGVGAALTNRLYWNRDLTGLYVGPAIAMVVNYDQFPGNSSYLNLLSSFEVGYQVPNSAFRWALKLEHLSNANLGLRNRGWNGISVLMGVAVWDAARRGRQPPPRSGTLRSRRVRRALQGACCW